MKILKLDDITTLPELRELTAEETEEALKLLRESWTEDDLRRFGEIDESEYTGDMGEFLEELERSEREEPEKRVAHES
jgi:hypothetical protein